MQRIAFLTLLFLSFALAARAETFTDAAGRTVELPARVERIMAAGPPASVLLYVLAPQKLAGWVHAPSSAEGKLLLPDASKLPELGRLTGKGNAIRADIVTKAKLDLIIDVGDVSEEYAALASRSQNETGVPYILLDGSLAKTPEVFETLGKVVGEPERGTELARYARMTLDKVNAGLAKIPADHRPRVYYGRGADGMQTGLARSINLELLDALGAVNVAAEKGQGGLTKVTPEEVAKWNPDIIIASDPKFAAMARSNPAWSGINAVKGGRVFVQPALPFGWFDGPPGVNRLMGIIWLEQLLYPDVFPTDLRKEAKAFYKAFYQVDLSDAQFDRLLQDKP
ncbi:ABC transporter substrate-binding protein [Phyllobacterium sp. BT25]|uniref:ABC transporter substrate-binding protein n=1 Tax=Phyllobacterium pellucidum TaxID=2740464 RepID=A0A849VR53_9HYPH|nr:ABC transporter substrate-binding protein [Phyllobacterium pellucidum]NTS32036.1 ABC transporter substrate-binding protein [Phyllobacterium pellucidum]